MPADEIWRRRMAAEEARQHRRAMWIRKVCWIAAAAGAGWLIVKLVLSIGG